MTPLLMQQLVNAILICESQPEAAANTIALAALSTSGNHNQAAAFLDSLTEEQKRAVSEAVAKCYYYTTRNGDAALAGTTPEQGCGQS